MEVFYLIAGAAALVASFGGGMFVGFHWGKAAQAKLQALEGIAKKVL